jgi:hypothetical protein
LLNQIAAIHGTGAAAGGGTSYESIATTTLGSTTATISFTSIPSTYKHLQLRIFSKSTRTAGNAGDAIKMNFNSDTAANYSFHQLQGNGATASASGSASQSTIEIERIGDATASIMGVVIVDILDYANTNKYKTTRSLGGVDFNGSGYVTLMSGNWRSTSAISSITLDPNGGDFAQYSQAALYGIKG